MIRAFTRSVAQLADLAIVRVLVRSLLLTLAVFAAIGFALARLLDGADPCGWVGEGACPLGGSALGIGATVATALLLWLLFPAVAIGVVSMFVDEVIAAVERRHYPDAAAASRPIGWSRLTWLGLRSSLRVLLYNLVALPLYLLLLVTGIGTVVAIVLVNGVAIGRDLGEMVAVRHLGGADLRDWLRRTRSPRAALGVFATALFLVPVVNLLAPVIAAAAATHLFHETGGRRMGTGRSGNQFRGVVPR